jgi:hypothetical protein
LPGGINIQRRLAVLRCHWDIRDRSQAV